MPVCMKLSNFVLDFCTKKDSSPESKRLQLILLVSTIICELYLIALGPIALKHRECISTAQLSMRPPEPMNSQYQVDINLHNILIGLTLAMLCLYILF